jgi:hypothetical protein
MFTTCQSVALGEHLSGEEVSADPTPPMEATDTQIRAAAHQFQLAEWVTADEAASRLRWDEQRKLVTNLVALEAIAI